MPGLGHLCCFLERECELRGGTRAESFPILNLHLGSKLRESGLRLPILALQATSIGPYWGWGSRRFHENSTHFEEAADYRSLRAEIRGPSGSPFEGHSFGLLLPGCRLLAS